MGSKSINSSKKTSHQLESKKPANFSTFPISLILAACVAGYCTAPAHAEGSRELVSSGGNRPFLEWTNLPATAGINRRTTLKVYVNAGETINLGSSVPNSFGGGITDIVYRSPLGVVGSCDVQATGFGLIDTLAKEAAGPLPAAGGYTPCTVVATESGIYEVDFHAPFFSATPIGNPTAIGANVPFPTDGSQLQTVAAWDITVTNGGIPIPGGGRVYADYLSLMMGGTGGTETNISPISSRTYIQTQDGYRYLVDLNGLQPFGFIFFANNRGFTDTAGNPLYRSISLLTGSALPGGVGLTPTEKVFLNPPAADLPGSASSPSGNTWLLASPAPPPTPTGFTFTGIEGTPNQTGTTPLGGNFSFNAPSVGTYSIQIDVNQDGDYNDPIDRILAGNAAIGANTIAWDGRDGFGNPVPASVTPYGASITLNAGEVHFPFLDAENNPGGLIIQRQIPGGGNTDTVYYNDTGLTGGTPPNPISALAGVPSSTGAHRYGNASGSQTEFGNNRGIDTWTNLPSAPVALVGGITVAAADLVIAKTDNVTTIAAGSPITYTITVTNNGPSTATGATVTDTIPASITGVNWTCAITAGTGACGTANGTGNAINTTVNLNSGATATYTVTGTVSPTATGTLSNTATVRRPNDTADPVDNDGSGSNNISESATDTTTIGPPSADLAITKTANQTSTTAGSAIAYTITVTNNGTSTVNSVTVTDTIPAGLTNPIYTPSTGTYDPANGAWTGLTLATGQSITLTINATVAANATGTLTNTATVAPPGGVTDPNNTNNQSQDTTEIVPPADLAVTKTVDNPNPTVGQNINYTVTLTNTGPSTATNVAITDQIPAGLTFISATPSQGTYDNTTGLWTVGTLANGASVTLTISATVNTTNPITNTATISASDQPDPDTTDNTGTVTVPQQQADLAVAKTVDTPNPTVGQTINYTVTLTNTGPSTATNVAITDQIPAGLTFISATPSQGTYDNTTGLWTVGTVANGSSVTLTISATVNTTNPITNTATISASDQPDPDTTDNTGTVTVPQQQADLAVAKTVDTPNPTVGQTINYTVTLTNTGPSTATNVAITDQIPAGLTFISATPSQGTYDNTIGLWTVGTVANGSSVTLTISATVNTTNPITNTATISASDQPDPDTTDNTGTVTVPQQQADLSVAKTVDNPNPGIGQNITYTVTLINTGPANATGVQVTDQIPAGLTFVSVTPSQGTYDNTTGLWNVGNVANGADATLRITATVNTTNVTNTAQVSASDQTDPDPTDNTGTVTVPTQGADLSLGKTVDNANPSVGRNLTYTVTLSNTGPAAATGVQVTDQLPAGLTFVSATPSQGTYNNTTGLWTVGNLANGAGATLRITATVNTTNPITNSAQVTASDQPDPDSTAGNSNPSEDDQASVSISQPVADLSLAKTVDNANPSVGQTIAYTVTLRNTGPANATGVQVTDRIPTGLTFVSATPSQGTYDNTTGLWTVGNVANGAAVTLTIQATLNTVGVVTNTAAITAAEQSDPDSTPGNNAPGEDDQASVSVPAKPNLRLVKRVTQINSTSFNDLVDDPADVNDNAANWPSNYLLGRTDGGRVQPGDEIEYTIYFLSDGSAPAGNVVLCDLVPPNLGFISNAFGAVQGISVFLNGNQQSYTNSADGDGGQFYPAGTLIPPPPGGVSPQPCGDANTNGAVVVNLGNIPTATGSNPANSYGFIRFRARFID
ncbi:DUF11 domain-containing protein [Microcoleus sp. FACHB-672]|uniref:DUF11 domain-containing protein n=1 Tax=Microcoleus sp. FACHB-672 TaxID=2692825 RepID=UPI0016895D3B|nr:DUF11 domain-containing protein [Microcoleus sp. FACHB-672]MBD2043102.1 DUF11 domain-containing protein [Microcoleus sp. FACHB-672]